MCGFSNRLYYIVVESKVDFLPYFLVLYLLLKRLARVYLAGQVDNLILILISTIKGLFNSRLLYSRVVLQDRGSGYKAYIFKESIRRYAIDYKG